MCTTHRNTPNLGATNESNFYALPAGGIRWDESWNMFPHIPLGAIVQSMDLSFNNNSGGSCLYRCAWRKTALAHLCLKHWYEGHYAGKDAAKQGEGDDYFPEISLWIGESKK